MAIDYNAKQDEPDLRSEQECFPDIDPGIEVLGDRVLVQLRREKVSSKGGILLVDETRQTLRFNETVAKVSANGEITAFKVGQTTITATQAAAIGYNQTGSVTYVLTINPVPVVPTVQPPSKPIQAQLTQSIGIKLQ